MYSWKVQFNINYEIYRYSLFIFLQLTADYGLRTDLKSFAGTITVGDGSAKNHSTSGRFFLATTLKYTSLLRKTMLDVDIAFLKNTNAIARNEHILCRIHIHLDNNCTIEFALDARRRILPTYATCLIEHMRGNTSEIGTNENL